mmetsp:Transcript_50510/g.157718  ORF Transcript_50510/g.157718 Transcript_50510/m.157718 type:complete len:215 (-) Transcript_50510:295-939(-)
MLLIANPLSLRQHPLRSSFTSSFPSSSPPSKNVAILHNRRLPSSELLITVSSRTCKLVIQSVCPLYVCIHLPVYMSHAFTVLSRDPLYRTLLAMSASTQLIQWLCPSAALNLLGHRIAWTRASDLLSDLAGGVESLSSTSCVSQYLANFLCSLKSQILIVRSSDAVTSSSSPSPTSFMQVTLCLCAGRASDKTPEELAAGEGALDELEPIARGR